MLENLDIASNCLRDALDQYLRVCSAIQKSYVSRSASNADSQDFAGRIKDEAHMLLNYDSKFKEAKLAITWARNSVALAPANILPPEILTRIFRFALAEERCSDKDEDNITRCSQNPESLSHVCSRWRQVALGSRDLWTHIDFCPEITVNDSLVLRAQTYIKRSEPLPLYIHIVDESVGWEELEYWGPSTRFKSSEDSVARAIQLIASVASRTRALDLTINCDYVDFHREALETCLKGCTPGLLSQLVVRGAASGYEDYCKVMTTSDGTLAANYHGNAKRSAPMDMSEQQP